MARVVEGVEDAEDVDAVLRGELDEAAEDVVGVVPVAEDVLAPEEHLEGRLAPGLDLAQALPGVLAQKAQADVEGRAAPAFEGIVARRIDGV